MSYNYYVWTEVSALLKDGRYLTLHISEDEKRCVLRHNESNETLEEAIDREIEDFKEWVSRSIFEGGRWLTPDPQKADVYRGLLERKRIGIEQIVCIRVDGYGKKV